MCVWEWCYCPNIPHHEYFTDRAFAILLSRSTSPKEPSHKQSSGEVLPKESSPNAAIVPPGAEAKPSDQFEAFCF